MPRIHTIVIGDPMLDAEREVLRTRTNPEEPDTFVRLMAPIETPMPGGAARAACYLRQLTSTREGPSEVSLVGLVGLDDDSRTLAEQLLLEGVEPRLATALAERFRTTRKERLVYRGELIERQDTETPGLAQVQDREILARILEGIETPTDGLLISDYGKGTLDAALADLAIAEAGSASVVFDPCESAAVLAGMRHAGRITLLTPNVREAWRLYEDLCPDSPEEPWVALAKHLGCAVAVTCGPDPVVVCFPDGRQDRVATRSWSPGTSACGAGDAFAAGCLASLIDSWPDGQHPGTGKGREAILEAVRVGCNSAARLVGRRT